MKKKTIWNHVLRGTSILLFAVALNSPKETLVQAETSNYLITINDVEWNATIYDGTATIQPVSSQTLTGDIVVPEEIDGYEVTRIRGFSNATSMTSVTIPSSVRYISPSTFAYCSKLEQINLSSGLQGIEALAFAHCSNLTSISIPDTVESINSSAFNNCTKLSSIDVNEHSAHFCSMEGVLYTKELGEMLRYPEGKTGTSYVVPDEVRLIRDYAFANGEDLLSITLPEGLRRIGNQAFLRCDSLVEMIVPENVTEIGESAFAWCTELDRVDLGSVSSIKNGAFTRCTKLRTVILPETLKKLERETFFGCTSLETVTFGGKYFGY